MKILIGAVVVIIIIGVGVALLGRRSAEAPPTLPLDAMETKTDTFSITSEAFTREGLIPPKYTCDGENILPPLALAGVPAETVSLALIMDDPDAVKPAGKVWDHWVVFNIPPETRVIDEGKEPAGVPGIMSAGATGYRGPCPPDGEHRYFFKAYALDRMLDLPAGSAKHEVLRALEGHILAEGELMGRYVRGR